MTQRPDQAQLDHWNAEIETLDLAGRLAWAARTFPGKVEFATSLGAEDQALTQAIAKHAPSIPIFTLDTGRLFIESYKLIADTEEAYGLRIKIVFPDRDRVEKMVAERGINLFYESVENRKLCCGVRKIEPLQRELKNCDAWIVGLRRDQSVTRTDMRAVEWDEGNGLVKISPLIDWSEAQVWDYVRANGVPYHPLHDQGYPSIGCACCTRAVAPGEDVRAGRWWWEQPEHKECGLHGRPGFGAPKAAKN